MLESAPGRLKSVKESPPPLLSRTERDSFPSFRFLPLALQVFYWLKQENSPSISAIALAIGRHRGTLLSLACHLSRARTRRDARNQEKSWRETSQWAEERLARRLEEAEGFKSYGEVQQWLETTLGVEAEYHAVYQKLPICAQTENL